MNKQNELLLNANEVVQSIYKQMNRVETCEALAEHVADLPVVFLDGQSYVSLDGVFDDQQMMNIRHMIIDQINCNKAEAEAYLKKLTGFEESAPAINEEPAEQMPELPEVVDELADIDEAEQEDIQEKRKPATVNQDFEDAVPYMIESGKKDASETKAVELTVELVKEKYTDAEDSTIDSVAAELGVSKSTLYRFISDNGLRKPKKDNTPWRGRR